jgi:hypothetical protein
VKLAPVRPPGPNRRKALAFAAEIRLLREQGHTFESIREALAAAGVHVSNSTVQREVARAARLQPSAPTLARPLFDDPAPCPSETPPVRPARPPESLPADGLSGKQVAEAFARNRITNPLIRAKDRP